MYARLTEFSYDLVSLLWQQVKMYVSEQIKVNCNLADRGVSLYVAWLQRELTADQKTKEENLHSTEMP